jgi:ribose-phosphate pyrophosphokinase
MIAAVKHLRQAGLPRPTCIAVHALFGGDAYDALRAAGAERIVTCNTLAYPANAIDVDEAVAERVRALLDANACCRA